MLIILKGGIDAGIKAIEGECIALRRDIHRHPELAFNETGTVERIASFLRRHGLDCRGYDFPSLICDTGPSPTIALRADMDALPVEERSGEEFSSENRGIMHACGHDAHSAMLACAGVVLRDMGVSARLLFQPAEERAEGAMRMIEQGCLDGIEHVFGLHVWPALDTGSIAVIQGPAMAAHGTFHALISGPGGHGAYPHLTPDTILAAASFVNSTSTVISRMVNPLDSAVISFGKIKGGHASNVIPPQVELEGTVRAFSADVMALLKERIELMLHSACESYGTTGSVEWMEEGPAVVNDREFALACRKALSPFLKVVDLPPTMGSEDFAYYLQRVKGAFAFLGTRGGEGTGASKHSSIFRLDERALRYGIAAHVLVALSTSGQNGN